MSVPPDGDDTRCPLCGQPNGCAMACDNPALQCWCSSVHIAPETLARIPPASRRVACLCPRCAGTEPAQRAEWR
ncbi:cysteine-rich CWC family protein [Thiomonas bhubaneswarensis]|uniref:cysteine-rich CWC family protein n=1 Tax=Thiomonas bhubaneswarensis TaxID=339866 RepID=UPI0009304F75|nr:cysteine-rich CWC family protein [Thiomonas bhubaneswarensis]